MRRVRYQVACSLDGYIATSEGGFDWIPSDPAIDFDALFAQFDTLLMGRITYEGMRGAEESFRGKRVVVLSRSLRQEDHPSATIISTDVEERVEALKRDGEKDIWLYGGGQTFRRLLSAGLVDTVEPAVVPVLLGGGVPLLPSPADPTALGLTSHRVYPSGIVLLEYEVRRGTSSESG